MRKLMLGVLGALAITIVGQGTTFAAEDEMTAVTTPQTVSSTTTTLRTQLSTSSLSTSALPRDTNLSNQNHSGDQ
jgi:hypothetical protein